MDSDSETREWLKEIENLRIDPEWDGKKSILKMRDEGGQYKQMEWAGFYFEHLLNETLGRHSVKRNEDPTDAFDYIFKDAILDAKTLCRKPGHDHRVLLNDQRNIDFAIGISELYFLVLVMEPVLDDEKRSFQAWHDEIKGGESAYSIKRKKRGTNSRIRKSAVLNKELRLYKIDETNVGLLKEFEQGRNRDGEERNKKYVLDTRFIQPIYTKRLGEDSE